MAKCIRCGLNHFFSTNFAGQDGLPGDSGSDFLCFECAPILRQQQQEKHLRLETARLAKRRREKGSIGEI